MQQGQPSAGNGDGGGKAGVEQKKTTAYLLFQRAVRADMYDKFGGKDAFTANLEEKHRQPSADAERLGKGPVVMCAFGKMWTEAPEPVKEFFRHAALISNAAVAGDLAEQKRQRTIQQSKKAKKTATSSPRNGTGSGGGSGRGGEGDNEPLPDAEAQSKTSEAAPKKKEAARKPTPDQVPWQGSGAIAGMANAAAAAGTKGAEQAGKAPVSGSASAKSTSAKPRRGPLLFHTSSPPGGLPGNPAASAATHAPAPRTLSGLGLAGAVPPAAEAENSMAPAATSAAVFAAACSFSSTSAPEVKGVNHGAQEGKAGRRDRGGAGGRSGGEKGVADTDVVAGNNARSSSRGGNSKTTSGGSRARRDGANVATGAAPAVASAVASGGAGATNKPKPREVSAMVQSSGKSSSGTTSSGRPSSGKQPSGKPSSGTGKSKGQPEPTKGAGKPTAAKEITIAAAAAAAGSGSRESRANGGGGGGAGGGRKSTVVPGYLETDEVSEKTLFGLPRGEKCAIDVLWEVEVQKSGQKAQQSEEWFASTVDLVKPLGTDTAGRPRYRITYARRGSLPASKSIVVFLSNNQLKDDLQDEYEEPMLWRRKGREVAPGPGVASSPPPPISNDSVDQEAEWADGYGMKSSRRR